MSNNFFYQSFERTTSNRISRCSSKDCNSSHGTPKFYESCLNYLLYEANNFTLKKVIIEKDPNAINEITQFVNNIRTKINFDYRTSFDILNSNIPSRQILTSNKLLQIRDIPMYYTISEEKILLSFDTKNFKKWFKNEIITILDLVELYSSSNYKYTLPKTTIDIARCPIISNYSNKVDLENEMYSYYRRVICLYSLITTDVMENIKKREQLFKELNFLKKLLEILMVTMDILGIRFTYFATDFTNHYPKTSFGSGSSKRMRDIVLLPESKFSRMGNLVVNSLINLL